MANSNAKITFEGLLLFCFPNNNLTGGAKSHCEIGILNETGEDEHEVVINIMKKDLNSGQTIPATPAEAGMAANPLKFSHQQIRGFSSLELYTGASQQSPPRSGVVTRDASFDKILNLEGGDFYGGKINLIEGRYTSMFAKTGEFSAIAETPSGMFCRVSKPVVEEAKKLKGRPPGWGGLLDADKRALAPFARKAEADVEIGQNQSLVLKGIRDDGSAETLFSLPHPSIIRAERYVISFSNSDKTSEPGAVLNCSAFLHHSLAIKSPRPGGKSEYGLMLNFDFDFISQAGATAFQRSEEACCDCGRLEDSGSLTDASKGLTTQKISKAAKAGKKAKSRKASKSAKTGKAGKAGKAAKTGKAAKSAKTAKSAKAAKSSKSKPAKKAKARKRR